MTTPNLDPRDAEKIASCPTCKEFEEVVRSRTATSILAAEKIAALALRVERQRQVADEIKKRRASFECEKPEQSSTNEYSGKLDGGECWRLHHWRYYPSRQPAEPDLWCQPCLDRQQAHIEYRAAAAKLGALRGALTKACRWVLEADDEA